LIVLTPPVGPPPLYPYDPADDWDPNNPNDNGVPGSDAPIQGFDGSRLIQFNSAIPPYSGSDRELQAWALSSIGPYKVGPSTFSGIIWDTATAGIGGIHVTQSLPVWEGYDHQSGFNWPGTSIGGIYYVALCAVVGNSPQPINVIDWMAPTTPPTERVAFTTGLVDFAGCANIFGGTLSGTTTITTTVLSFASYAHAASWFKIV